MPDPIDVLMDEHRIIEKVLTAFEQAAHLDLPVTFYEKAVEFIANFADGCHHAKEEERLFPELERKGVPRAGGPIGVMCDEHVLGRAHVARMREMIDADDRDGLRREALEYAALLRGHIAKEDNVLFPLGRAVLDPSELAALETSFERVDCAGECHHKYAALATQLLAEANA